MADKQNVIDQFQSPDDLKIPDEVKRLQDMVWSYGADHGVDHVLLELAMASIAEDTRFLSDMGASLQAELDRLKQEGVPGNKVAKGIKSITDHMRDIEEGAFDQ